MDLLELDKYLRELNIFEKKVLSLKQNYAINDRDKKMKLFYANDLKESQWTIESKKFLKDDEMIGIHKHDRFIKFDTHKHDYLEMIYVYSGSIRQTIGQSQIEVKAGEIIILDLNISHSIEPAMKGDIAANILIKKEFFDWIVMSQLADNDIISDFIVKTMYDKRIYKSYLHFHTSDNHKVQNLMKSLLCEFYDPSFCTETVIKSYMMLIFTELLRMHKKSFSKISKQRFNTAIETEITRYLRKEYKEVSIKKLAEHFNFNPDYLGKIIKQTTGKTFTDLLQDIRMKQACLLLEKSDYPINEIIKEIGYSNKSYFYRIFKRQYELTPDEYRTKYFKGQ
ncbi:AraC family transcriptional regulator [Vallitalea okinawensis]|uniref:AraC family transcriptional regulator n=1 Tax=Vallitalea okinawensis TaxID=2078660 RepID=UPI0014789113|nr:AraC family transcriptional regulator [Vallitalea okinawensis]